MSTIISNISFILKFAWKQVPCLQTPGILHLDPNMSYHQLCSDMLQANIVGPLPSFTNAGGSVHSMRIGVGYTQNMSKEGEIWETAKPPGRAQYPTLFREHLGQLQPLADCPRIMWYPWLRPWKLHWVALRFLWQPGMQWHQCFLEAQDMFKKAALLAFLRTGVIDGTN